MSSQLEENTNTAMVVRAPTTTPSRRQQQLVYSGGRGLSASPSRLPPPQSRTAILSRVVQFPSRTNRTKREKTKHDNDGINVSISYGADDGASHDPYYYHHNHNHSNTLRTPAAKRGNRSRIASPKRTQLSLVMIDEDDTIIERSNSKHDNTNSYTITAHGISGAAALGGPVSRITLSPGRLRSPTLAQVQSPPTAPASDCSSSSSSTSSSSSSSSSVSSIPISPPPQSRRRRYHLNHHSVGMESPSRTRSAILSSRAPSINNINDNSRGGGCSGAAAASLSSRQRKSVKPSARVDDGLVEATLLAMNGSTGSSKESSDREALEGARLRGSNDNHYHHRHVERNDDERGHDWCAAATNPTTAAAVVVGVAADRNRSGTDVERIDAALHGGGGGGTSFSQRNTTTAVQSLLPSSLPLSSEPPHHHYHNHTQEVTEAAAVPIEPLLRSVLLTADEFAWAAAAADRRVMRALLSGVGDDDDEEESRDREGGWPTQHTLGSKTSYNHHHHQRQRQQQQQQKQKHPLLSSPERHQQLNYPDAIVANNGNSSDGGGTAHRALPADPLTRLYALDLAVAREQRTLLLAERLLTRLDKQQQAANINRRENSSSGGMGQCSSIHTAGNRTPTATDSNATTTTSGSDRKNDNSNSGSSSGGGPPLLLLWDELLSAAATAQRHCRRLQRLRLLAEEAAGRQCLDRSQAAECISLRVGVLCGRSTAFSNNDTNSRHVGGFRNENGNVSMDMNSVSGSGGCGGLVGLLGWSQQSRLIKAASLWQARAEQLARQLTHSEQRHAKTESLLRRELSAAHCGAECDRDASGVAVGGLALASRRALSALESESRRLLVECEADGMAAMLVMFTRVRRAQASTVLGETQQHEHEEMERRKAGTVLAAQCGVSLALLLRLESSERACLDHSQSSDWENICLLTWQLIILKEEARINKQQEQEQKEKEKRDAKERRRRPSVTRSLTSPKRGGDHAVDNINDDEDEDGLVVATVNSTPAKRPQEPQLGPSQAAPTRRHTTTSLTLDSIDHNTINSNGGIDDNSTPPSPVDAAAAAAAATFHTRNTSLELSPIAGGRRDRSVSRVHGPPQLQQRQQLSSTSYLYLPMSLVRSDGGRDGTDAGTTSAGQRLFVIPPPPPPPPPLPPSPSNGNNDNDDIESYSGDDVVHGKGGGAEASTGRSFER